MRPKSGALARSGERTIVLWDVERGGKQPPQYAPGVVSNMDPEGPRIATVDGSVVIHKALIGGRVRSGRELGLQLGDRLE
jgi:hypothetical protein